MNMRSNGDYRGSDIMDRRGGDIMDRRGGGGSGGSDRGSSENNYINYANLLKENFEGTSLDNLDSGSGNSKRVRIKDVDIEKDNDKLVNLIEDNDELVDLIKDNVINSEVINSEVIKKNRKGIKKIENKAKSFLNINYKEFALLFFIYFLLSQEMIKDGFALYFTSLNPDESGRIGVKGVIIYGLLLTTIFILLRNYLL
jgi:hypothetical protein